MISDVMNRISPHRVTPLLLRSFLLLFALAIVLSVGPVYAQVPTGVIAGTVKDVQNLPVEGAQVTLTSIDTTRTYIATTSSTGSYQFNSINYGRYKISVSKDGFKEGVVDKIKLDASTVYSVAPITLEVGAASETITVEGGEQSIQTTSAEVRDTIEKAQIDQLPILDRQVLSLIALQPGVANNGIAGLGGPGQTTAINGQRQGFSNVTLDGINIQDNFIRDNDLDFFPNKPFASQAQEFTIITQNAGVENGGGASQVSIVTPRGTNDWHGQAFYYYRTNAWSANDWFNNASGVPQTNLLQNQGGFNVGGPVIKNKLFVYGYYELLRKRASFPSIAQLVSPGIRSAVNAAKPTLPFTYTPNCTNVPQPCSTAPVTVDLFTLERNSRGAGAPIFTPDPAIVQLLSKTPTTPNNTRLGDGVNTLGFQFNDRSNETRDNYGTRVDYEVNNHNTISTTWSWNRDNLDRPDLDGFFFRNIGFGGFGPVPAFHNAGSTKFLSTAWRFSPSANWTNEVRFGFNISPGYFINNSPRPAGTFTPNGYTLAFTDPINELPPSGRDTHTWAAQDNANWVHGNHVVKFGTQFQRVTIYTTSNGGLGTCGAGNITVIDPSFCLGFSSSNPFGLAPSDFTGGRIRNTDLGNAGTLLATFAGVLSEENQGFNVRTQTSGFVPEVPNQRNLRQNNWAFYVGDTWKINRKLTATIGVRYEYYTPVDERDGLGLLPVIPAGQTAAQTLLGNAVVDFAGGPSKRRFYNPRWANFSPNLGLAWDPFGNGKWAIRAGFSTNYVNDYYFTAVTNALAGNAGLSPDVELGPLPAGVTVSKPIPIAAPTISIPTDLATESNTFGVQAVAGYAIDPHIKSPYVEQWNLSIQKDLGWNTTLTVSYVGNHGVGLYRAIDVNQVIVAQNGFLADVNRARSNGFLAQATPANAPGCGPRGSETQCGVFNPLFNSAVTGSQVLTIFPNICGPGGNGAAGPDGVPFINDFIRTGQAGALADTYHIFGCSPSPNFFAPSDLIRGGDLLKNGSFSTYHAGIVEVRRRLDHGLYLQANYTYSKVLTDFAGVSNQFSPLSDNARPGYERSRSPIDLTHAFKANFTYELPIGRGHHFAPTNKVLDIIASGWSTSSIFQWQSGLPFSILSDLATVNRAGLRSSRNTAFSTLSHQQISSHLGVFKNADGTVDIIDPSFINADGTGAAQPGLTCVPSNAGGFCNPQPGQLGNLPLDAFNGPTYFDWDVSASKAFRVTERLKLTFRADAYNVLNHPVFGALDQDINNNTFGQSGGIISQPRIIQLSLHLAF